MKELNTMETFTKGFKIIRDGEIITLTAEEMSDFRYLDKAITGRDCLEFYKEWAVNTREEEQVIENMMADEETCYNIEEDILENVYQDIGMIEQDIIKDYIERNYE